MSEVLKICAEPRRAAVALIVRVVPSPNSGSIPPPSAPPSLSEFFELDWVRDPGARAEILFLRREKPSTDEPTNRPGRSGETHVAFPGGRMEEGDEGGLYTGMFCASRSCARKTYSRVSAMRQTWEEIGLDLAEKDYTCIGQLDDREITTSLGKRLLMILSPFGMPLRHVHLALPYSRLPVPSVFLQLTPVTRETDPAPETTLHWIPISSLVSFNGQPTAAWSYVTVDAASRLASRHATLLRLLVRWLVGSMQYPAIVLDTNRPHSPSGSHIVRSESSLPTPAPSPANEKALDRSRAMLESGKAGLKTKSSSSEELKLWGLSLGMTLDLMSYMTSPSAFASALPFDADAVNVMGVSMGAGLAPPSLTSVFPRFSYPDVNFWIW
jgi:8-oxo-dGTP pyrophosphatase MutT (NUDIX family)